MILRVLIVDDEPPARRKIRRFLDKESDVEVVGEAGNGERALRAIRELEPDLVFLDIQMQHLDGFDVVDQINLDTPPVFIFITAYDQYAVRAFEAAALDYLLKPFVEERFYMALDRARARLQTRHLTTYSNQLLALLQDRQPAPPPSSVPPKPREYGRLVLKTGSRLVFLDASEIDWVEAQGVYVQLHVGAKTHLLRESLTNVEHRLDPQQFIRIHRSTLVNLDRIKEIIPHLNGGSIVVLDDGRRLKMSRSYRDKVNATLG